LFRITREGKHSRPKDIHDYVSAEPHQYSTYLREKTSGVFQRIQIAGLKENDIKQQSQSKCGKIVVNFLLKKIKNMKIGTSGGERFLLKEFVYSVCKIRQNIISHKTHRSFLLLK